MSSISLIIPGDKKMNQLTLGSLFDGIGGFPFAGTIAGIQPVWAAEIEAFCVAVTKHHFPTMEHLGSVTDIDGAKITPVDIITFGSPCQDLSTAGKRAGLDGERSGLFKEAIRIIYEMRSATNGRYPAYMVWENVPGAFSSNNGLDFKTVLEKVTKTSVPMPDSGRWANAGVVRGNGVSAAWRQLDAQYWGVPQRRKRIYLIGSFGSNSAEEILFERDSVCRYLAPSGAARKGFAADTEGSVVVGSECFDALCSAGFLDRAPAGSYSIGFEEEKAPTLRAGMIPSIVYSNQQFGAYKSGFGTLRSRQADIIVVNNMNLSIRRLTPLECERLQGYPDYWTELPKIEDMTDDEYSFFLRVYMLDKAIRGQAQKKQPTKASLVKWYNKLDSDSNRYKALGNSLAIPCALRVLSGIAEHEVNWRTQ